jgi:hypothetical protein
MDNVGDDEGTTPAKEIENLKRRRCKIGSCHNLLYL